MHELRTWRDLLGKIISDPLEKQRIAEELSINTITLDRWANNQSDPRPQNLRRLHNALPRHQEMLLDLISDEFPEFTGEEKDDTSKEIPPAFYARIFASRSVTARALRFWSIGNLILEQALGQLDPDRVGMAITVARFMPPRHSQKVHSLRESIGWGTSPWAGNLEQKAMFLGAESLAGYAATSCHPAAIQNLEEEDTLLPAHQIEGELSAAVYPILYVGRIAGCLIVSSTQTNYFLAQSRLTLIQHYADLMALAFDAEDFYEPDDIQLHIMPSHEVQKAHFANFRQRIAQAMRQAANMGQPISNVEAELLVWQQLEEEFIQLSSETDG